MMPTLSYHDRNTAIHRLNPAVKLAWGVTIVILSLIFDHPLFVLALLVAVVLMVLAADVRREWARVMKLGVWLGASIIVINALVSFNGDHVLLTAPFTLPVMGQPVITLEAIAFGAVMAVKLLVIISAFTLINLTVHPDEIMLVLLKMKLPYKSVLVTSLSTRFIPCLAEDMQRINDAYRTRGGLRETGNWFVKIKSRAGTIIPLLSNSLDRAVQVAEAMEARGFGNGQRRTFYRNIGFSRLDWLILAWVLLSLAAGITIRILSFGGYEYYPALTAINPDRYMVVSLGILTVFLLAILPFASFRRRLALD